MKHFKLATKSSPRYQTRRRTRRNCTTRSVDNILECQLDGERALHCVMHIVCKYSSVKDLCNVAKVCKSWRYAALYEIGKRCYFQQLRLTYKIDINLASQLEVNPYVSLLIYDSSIEKSLSLPATEWFDPYSMKSNGLEEDLLEDFRKQLPNNTIVVMMTHKCLTTKDVEFQRNKKNPDILGLFLPSMKQQVQVHVAWSQVRNPLRETLAPDYYAKKLGLNSCKYPESTILLFVGFAPTRSFRPIISELDKRAQGNGKRIVWSCMYGRKLVALAGNRQRKCYGRNNSKTIIALRISGPGVESWGTFIFRTARREEIERKLHALKKKVKRNKRHYIGLLSSYNCVDAECSHEEHPNGNSHDMMCTLERFFPCIRFVGLFEDRPLKFFIQPYNPEIPEQSTDNESGAFDEEFLKNLRNYASIIIISYD